MNAIKPKRFIPFSKNEIFKLCLKQIDNETEQQSFKQLYQLLSHTFHFEFYKINEALKESYSSTQSKHQFIDLLNGLLNKANYERISQHDLKSALNEASLFKIKLEVDFNDFSEVLLFCRDESMQTETVKQWFGLSRKTFDFAHYDRVVIYLKFKDELVSKQSNSTVLKLFKNVPKADLEMLFPNTQVRMRLKDKLLIGIPALVSGGIVISTKLGASVIIIVSILSYWLGLNQQPLEISKTEILALLAGVGTLGAYLWKQYSNFKNRKLRFMQSLTQNLYFKNLDNNEGVFHRLIDEAEEEEVKEALLAYFFLNQETQGLSKQSLDNKIEQWLLKQKNTAINFEIDDALNKLIELNLVTIKNDHYQAIELNQALKILDKRWDDYFTVSS